ncbi:MAG: hypothetical protein ABI333_24425 [bacterium]
MSDDSPTTESEAGALSPRPRSLRRRLAFPILVVGIAALVALWSRGRPVEVEITYDFGKLAPRLARLVLSYRRGKGEEQSVDASFPSPQGAPRRYRHTLKLKPGAYTIRARLHLRAVDGAAEVRRVTRRIQVESGSDQRIKLRFGR